MREVGIVVKRSPVRCGEGRHYILPCPRERGHQHPIIAPVVAIIVARTPPVHPPPLLLLFLAREPAQGRRLAPAMASPLSITAFLLVRVLLLVLQGKQLQQTQAIALAHQPRKGCLGVVPLLLIPPAISPPSRSFFPVCLLAVVVVVAVVVEVVVVIIVAVPPAVKPPPRPGCGPQRVRDGGEGAN
jgi:hypothetical protein